MFEHLQPMALFGKVVENLDMGPSWKIQATRNRSLRNDSQALLLGPPTLEASPHTLPCHDHHNRLKL